MPDVYKAVEQRLFWTVVKKYEGLEPGEMHEVMIGAYNSKFEADFAAGRLSAAGVNMDFAEWFYGQDKIMFDDGLRERLYAMWRDIGGHLTIQRTRDFLDKVVEFAEAWEGLG